MIYSNQRKQILSGWLKENDALAYGSPLRLQKYLFFYEVFSKTAGEKYDFYRLRGYRHGPVFSTVWGDYTKNRDDFNRAIEKQYQSHRDMVNVPRARKSAFIVNSLSERELSSLTHKFNIWKAKAERIDANERQVDLYDSDFCKNDYDLAAELSSIYSDEIVSNSVIIPVGVKFFVVDKKAMGYFTESHMETLCTLADGGEVVNPVFVDISESGELVVD